MTDHDCRQLLESLPGPLRPDARCFAIHAAADPSVLPRVLELFAQRNFVPDNVACERRADSLAIVIVVSGMSEHAVAVVAAKLEQIVAVTGVSCHEIPTAEAVGGRAVA